MRGYLLVFGNVPDSVLGEIASALPGARLPEEKYLLDDFGTYSGAVAAFMAAFGSEKAVSAEQFVAAFEQDNVPMREAGVIVVSEGWSWYFRQWGEEFTDNCFPGAKAIFLLNPTEDGGGFEKVK